MTLTNAPTLETDRLILRGPALQDAEPLIDFLTDKPRAWGFGAYDTRAQAWRWYALSIGHWHIHGYGYFTIEDKATGDPAGLCGIWNPEGWPEPEIGWIAFAPFEGKGIAYEAALTVRRWAFESLGFTTLTSNIVPGNTRSQVLARRLGATHESTYQNVSMGTEELWRHPSPEALS